MTAVSAPPASAAQAPASEVMSHRQILLVIYALMGGMFLAALDQTVVGTAIRTIGDDLHGLNEQAWVTTAYLITSTIATPIYGKLSDIFGRRPLYLFGIVVFLLGSAASSFSTSMLMLAGFRAIQGIGAGALMSLPLAIMGDMLAPRERAKYQGFFLSVFGVSSVIGPLIGGLFAGAPQILFITGWRWVFLVNVPIGIAALAMVIAFLHLPRFGTRSVRIDWFGAAAVVATLVPLLLVAEQGRTWGWTSAGSIACYVIGAVGLVGFIVAETIMKDDAIIPLSLFRAPIFSMATVLSVLVGFGMFGALLTLPLYLQIVVGLSPTQSGFASLPLVAGLMAAAITSGQIVSRTGKYRIFPVTGTAFMAVGFLWLTTMSIDRPLWYLMIGMFILGLGLGQMMQSLTLAVQGSVKVTQIGVATSAATFFRQIGGTIGTAVLLSVLFSTLPGSIATATQDRAILDPALSAALTPSVASAPQNRLIMKQLWAPIVGPIETRYASALDKATDQVTAAVDKATSASTVDAAAKKAVTAQVTKAVDAQLPAGTPDATRSALIEQQVAAALPAAQQQAESQAAAARPAATAKALQTAATKAHASVVDGKLAVDYANASQRQHVVDAVAPDIVKAVKKGTGGTSSSTSDASDTSFLKGADPRLTRPFLTGFNASAVQLYWVGLIVILLAFVITWFFRVPPLRQRSALQEQADRAAADQVAAGAGAAAATSGAPVAPATGAVQVVHSQAADIRP